MSSPHAPTPPRSLREAVEERLDAPGTLTASVGGLEAEVEVVDCDRLGAVVDRISVRGGTGDIEDRALAIAKEARPGGDRLVPIEVDQGLGGAILRSGARDLRRGFYELRLDEDSAELSGHKLTSEGLRSRVPYTWTRDQLGRFLDELEQALRPRE